MLRKILKRTFGTMFIAGFILMVGTVGGLDLDQINLTTAVIRVCISVLCLVTGYIGLKATGCEWLS